MQKKNEPTFCVGCQDKGESTFDYLKIIKINKIVFILNKIIFRHIATGSNKEIVTRRDGKDYSDDIWS